MAGNTSEETAVLTAKVEMLEKQLEKTTDALIKARSVHITGEKAELNLVVDGEITAGKV